MKIGHVSLSYRPVLGGQDTYIENLKKVLSDRGHESTVYQGLSPRFKVDRQGIKTVPLLPILGRFIKNFNWYYFNWGLKAFTSSLKKEDALIVHYAVHYPAVKFHPRVIILSHGMEWHTPFDQWDDPLRARRARETFEKCTVVANDTEYLRFCGLDVKPGTRYFEEVAPEKFFIPNCVDTDKFKKTEPDLEIKKLNAILVPRNIYYHRGIHLAIEAFGLLVQEGNKENNLVIIGNVVDKKYYGELLKLIARYGIEKRVFFLGHTPWKDLPPKYSAAQCTVIPTVDCEGTSLSALESMACETPVVATSVGGLKDLPCLEVTPTPEGIKNGIKKVLENRDKYAAEQHSAVLSTFNMDNWKEAWQRVLDQRRSH